MESQEIFLDRPGHTLLKRKRAKRQRRPASPITGSSSSTDKEDEDMANCLMLLSQGDQSYGPSSQTDQEHEDHTIDGVSKMDFSSAVKSRRLSEMGSNLYQCKTCDKVFSSFQALGGHRASHKKPNKAGAAAPEEGKIYRKITLDTTCASSSPSPDPTPNPHPGLELGIGIKSNKVHECSICGTEFGSGQALGGHMRRHRSTNADVDESDKKPRNVLELDLNLPAPEEHDLGDSGYGFEPRQPAGLVLSATPLVDCRY